MKVKKAYLLAGSISLVSLFAGGVPAQAANDSLNDVAPETSAASLLSEVSQPGDALVASDLTNLTNTQPAAPTANLAPAATPIVADATNQPTSVNQLAAESEATIGQVTSVSQLSDVQPTDWAFQALQSLVEKYGCIAGYPDGTFKGSRAATRYELAAALNACLDVISDRFATKEDLAKLRALQEEFAAELATLRGRVDNLEARTAQLEATQFSTTTKLQGVAVFSFQAGAVTGGPYRSPAGFPNIAYPLPQGAFPPNGVTAGDTGTPTQSGSPTGFAPYFGAVDGAYNPTIIAATLISLNTSFTGNDLLQTTLSFGNGGLDTISTAGVGTTPALGGLTGGTGQPNAAFFNPGQYYWSGFQSTGTLYRLAYTFKPFKDVTITAGPQFYPSDIIDFNSYANAPASDFGSYFFINNPFIIPYAMNFQGGAGAAVQWNPGGGGFTLKALYMAAAAGIASPATGNGFTNQGFVGDPYQASVELQYANTFNGGKNNFAVRLQFTNSTTFNVNSNAVGLNAEATFGKFGVFGRFGYAWLNAPAGFNPLPYSIAPFGLPLTAGDGNVSYQAITFMGGLAYKDLLVPGSLIGVAAGSPFLTQGADAQAGYGNTGNQINVEAFYRFPVTDNISVTPIFSAIFNPGNLSNNGTIYQGVLRTTFTF